MIRLLWHRLGESTDARLLRIRRFGLLRFCAIYALVFPAAHALAAGFRAAFIGSAGELANLPVETACWAGTGAAVAVVLWFAGLRRPKVRDESSVSRVPASRDHRR